MTLKITIFRNKHNKIKIDIGKIFYLIIFNMRLEILNIFKLEDLQNLNHQACIFKIIFFS